MPTSCSLKDWYKVITVLDHLQVYLTDTQICSLREPPRNMLDIFSRKYLKSFSMDTVVCRNMSTNLLILLPLRFGTWSLPLKCGLDLMTSLITNSKSNSGMWLWRLGHDSILVYPSIPLFFITCSGRCHSPRYGMGVGYGQPYTQKIRT